VELTLDQVKEICHKEATKIALRAGAGCKLCENVIQKAYLYSQNPNAVVEECLIRVVKDYADLYLCGNID
jgi:hypothetical protein